MEKRFLGRSGLQVSALGFGLMTFTEGGGRWSSVGATQGDAARRQVDLCLDAGINFFDTADTYGGGASERILREALGDRRAGVVLATKCFFGTNGNMAEYGLSRRHIIESCEASLERLGTDWIDLYQLHQFDALTPLEETLSALDHLLTSGKVRYVGCSNFHGWQLMKSLAIADARGFERIIGQQIQYSLMVRDAEAELLPCGVDQGVGAIIWGAIASGFLSGKYGRQAEGEATRLSRDPRLAQYAARGQGVLDAVFDIAQAHDASPTQVALNWLLARPGVSCALIGARTEEQLVDNLKTASWSLSDDEIARLDRESQKPEVGYPEMMAGFLAGRNPALFPRQA